MAVPETWEWKSLRELELRKRLNLSIVAVHDMLGDVMHVPPDPDAPLKDTDTLIVAGKKENLERLARQK
jgi:trk system potassium uptake protein TrkA